MSMIDKLSCPFLWRGINKIKQDMANKHRAYLNREQVVQEINEATNARRIGYDTRAEAFMPIIKSQEGVKEAVGEVKGALARLEREGDEDSEPGMLRQIRDATRGVTPQAITRSTTLPLLAPKSKPTTSVDMEKNFDEQGVRYIEELENLPRPRKLLELDNRRLNQLLNMAEHKRK